MKLKMLSAAALSGVCLMLAACADEANTTTVLSIENEAINLSVPDELLAAFDEGIFNDSLRPEVIFNGDLVSVNRGAGNDWSGRINVPTNATYEVSIIWSEIFAGQRLDLSSRFVNIVVDADGSTRQEGGTDYESEFDDDADGLTNLDERTDDDDSTDPLVFNS